jgi:hypothetical protein
MPSPAFPIPDLPASDPAALPASAPKWWGHSLTIWGVIITSLSTVLPALGPVFGLNITAELIRQLGDSVVVFGQALGGLIGTVMAVWGRIRADTPVERRQFTIAL